MIRIVVAVKDRATDLYGQPFMVAAIGQATRSFIDELNRQAEPGQNPMYHHPEDFDLYQLGIFDDQKGTYTNEPNGPLQIAIGKHFHKGNGTTQT